MRVFISIVYWVNVKAWRMALMIEITFHEDSHRDVRVLAYEVLSDSGVYKSIVLANGEVLSSI